ncbi:MAG: DHHA1 domain-containing protein [Azovibrio sp.]
MTKNMVYYHGDCLDGFGAAYAAWHKLGDSALYMPMYHGQAWNPEDVAGKQVYILDFSFPQAELEAMAKVAGSVLMLDHHSTARKVWQKELGNDTAELSQFTHADYPLTVAFDLSKSGARLAWEHFHPDIPVPLALLHIEDQDLWNFSIPNTASFCRALRLQPWEFKTWDSLIQACKTPESTIYQTLCTEGTAIGQFMYTEVQRLLGSDLVVPVSLPLPPGASQTEAKDSLDGLSINANNLFASELGHHLAQRSGTFGLIWHLGSGGRVKVSLRAENQVNVAMIAEQYGGGGHPNAAGFSISLDRFKTEILKL